MTPHLSCSTPRFCPEAAQTKRTADWFGHVRNYASWIGPGISATSGSAATAEPVEECDWGLPAAATEIEFDETWLESFPFDEMSEGTFVVQNAHERRLEERVSLRCSDGFQEPVKIVVALMEGRRFIPVLTDGQERLCPIAQNVIDPRFDVDDFLLPDGVMTVQLLMRDSGEPWSFGLPYWFYHFLRV